MTNSHIIRKGANPQRNFRSSGSRKRCELLFSTSFERAFLARRRSIGISWREFGVSNYGVADLLWVGSILKNGESSSFCLEKIEERLLRSKLTAFELKLQDWRGALSQAFRYGYFADQAIVVVPPDTGAVARKRIDLFEASRVGLWIHEKGTSRIEKIWTPETPAPRSRKAKERAVGLILDGINFERELRKRCDLSGAS